MEIINEGHLENMQKRQETIEKVYKEKAHYLDEVDTKEDAFMEGINAAMQLLNLHLVSECYSPEDRLDILGQERDELMKKEHSAGLMMEVGRKLGAMQEIERIFNIR